MNKATMDSGLLIKTWSLKKLHEEILEHKESGDRETLTGLT